MRSHYWKDYLDRVEEVSDVTLIHLTKKGD